MKMTGRLLFFDKPDRNYRVFPSDCKIIIPDVVPVTMGYSADPWNIDPEIIVGSATVIRDDKGLNCELYIDEHSKPYPTCIETGLISDKAYLGATYNPVKLDDYHSLVYRELDLVCVTIVNKEAVADYDMFATKVEPEGGRMDNYTYYKEEIEKIIRDGDRIAVKDGRVCACQDTKCNKCELNKSNTILSCKDVRKKWLNSEHDEKPKLTKDEYTLLSLINPDWYLVCEGPLSLLYLYSEKPTFDVKRQAWGGSAYKILFSFARTVPSEYFVNGDVSFSFIKNTDKEPWQVRDLLKLEVK